MVGTETAPAGIKPAWRRRLLLVLFGFAVYFTVESLQPPGRQPSARVCLMALELYQAVGSPVARWVGFRCLYTPTCSRYAMDAVARHGTFGGMARALGRLWRCSPWGGGGGVDRISTS